MDGGLANPLPLACVRSLEPPLGATNLGRVVPLPSKGKRCCCCCCCLCSGGGGWAPLPGEEPMTDTSWSLLGSTLDMEMLLGRLTLAEEGTREILREALLARVLGRPAETVAAGRFLT